VPQLKIAEKSLKPSILGAQG